MTDKLSNKEYLKKWHKEHPNYDKKRYDRMKNLPSEKERRKSYYSNNKEELNKKRMTIYKENIDTERERMRKVGKLNRDKRNEYEKLHKKDSIKVNAQQLARDKIIIKPACEICGSTDRLQKHHWNYNKPLLVNTLCGTCHKIQHIKNFEESIYA